ncbi:HAMP domain-containing histidine kinase [Clostridium sp. CX1]|uniref:HAMP domain-containing sensor histidine kinase n=1 Tax=Clostridium sp. CX1 TaxID=2978346 RepID=UPI0021C1713A|nr:HAMP domain-containing sensor histidine kinase [Clostridium sp. CX1]MCT8978784.1 HAMP domain-containing histidine kinase [Clostridium sp. CX1]
MKRYFTNPELKMSSVILFLSMILFFIANIFVQRLYYNDLKNDYIRSVGAVAARIVEHNPSLEKEIMPLVTKEISQEDQSKGKAFLSQYSLTTNLDNGLFPYINETSKKSNYFTLLIFIVMTALFLLLNYLQYAFFYKKIRRLTIGAKKVVDGDYDLTINENKEGDLSKLAVSFNSMREIIKNNIGELKKEKQFLVDLLSDISHQLKTPLSSMVVYNDIMLSKELSKEQSKTFLLSNQNQLDRMHHLIHSILKLAKIDAKAIELDREKQSLNETIQEAIDSLESKALEHRVKVNFIEKEEVNFEHDRLWLEEALINIIKNGIEHTLEDGEVTINLYENPVYRRIIIEDTGEGIREDDLPNIFKRFYKARTSKKSDSVGIGLALAKSIVEAHEGIIEAESKIGIGTRFTLTFLKF